MAALWRILTVSSHLVVAAALLCAFVPLTTGLVGLGDPGCDEHLSSDDGDDHCPPFCDGCQDCAGCFHVHAVIEARTPQLAPRIPLVVRPGASAPDGSVPDAPVFGSVHVPRRLG